MHVRARNNHGDVLSQILKLEFSTLFRFREISEILGDVIYEARSLNRDIDLVLNIMLS